MKITRLFIKFFAFYFIPIVSFGQADSVMKHVSDPDGGWIIHTKSSAYQLLVTKDKKLYPVFYGPIQQATYKKRTPLWTPRLEEVPARGGSANKTAILEVIFKNHVRAADLEYVSGNIIEVDGRPTLMIVEKDRFYPLQVTSYIRVLSKYNVLEKWIEVKNTGNKDNIEIQNLLSGSILLPTDRYILTQLSGSELGEFQPSHSDITPGLKIIENRMFKSNNNMPWFLIRPKESSNDKTGPAWWGCVHYSGNWRIIFDDAYDRQYNSTLQIAGGINFWDTEWTLHPGETFIKPKFSTGYTKDGAEGAARDNATYVRRTILPPGFRDELRPVLFNGWVNTTYFINDSIELAMAKEAAKLGVELFAIDDGWFKGRNSGAAGLGDWVVDKIKFPNGLQPLIDSVHKMGMKFGLWVKPESVVKNTDLYRKHPNWVLEYPNRKPTPTRIFLNFAREDVFQFLFHSLNKILSENKIDFIKWDQNSYLNDDVGWADATPDVQKEVRIMFIGNVYRLVDTLRKLHPNVLFESCASGGGRVDLGMLSRMDQVWTSDNSKAIDRIFIQYGYLSAMPVNTMDSWVLGNWLDQKEDFPSLSFRFDVAMSGLLGISDKILNWTLEEKAVAKKKIEIYKAIRPLVQQGTLYRLASPFENNRCALQYNSNDSGSAVVFCYNLAMYVTANYDKNPELTSGAQFLNQGATVLKLQGLSPENNYKVQMAGDDKDQGQIYKGDYLMNIGIAWPLKKSFESSIFTLKEVP